MQQPDHLKETDGSANVHVHIHVGQMQQEQQLQPTTFFSSSNNNGMYSNVMPSNPNYNNSRCMTNMCNNGYTNMLQQQSYNQQPLQQLNNNCIYNNNTNMYNNFYTNMLQQSYNIAQQSLQFQIFACQMQIQQQQLLQLQQQTPMFLNNAHVPVQNSSNQFAQTQQNTIIRGSTVSQPVKVEITNQNVSTGQIQVIIQQTSPHQQQQHNIQPRADLVQARADGYGQQTTTSQQSSPPQREQVNHNQSFKSKENPVQQYVQSFPSAAVNAAQPAQLQHSSKASTNTSRSNEKPTLKDGVQDFVKNDQQQTVVIPPKASSTLKINSQNVQPRHNRLTVRNELKCTQTTIRKKLSLSIKTSKTIDRAVRGGTFSMRTGVPLATNPSKVPSGIATVGSNSPVPISRAPPQEQQKICQNQRL